MSRERRTDNRVDIDWKVRIGKRGLGVANGQAKNASISGLYMATSLDLQKGDRAMLEIRIDSDSSVPPVLCEAVVVRKDQKEGLESISYGLQFSRMDDDALQRIFTVIAELWGAQESLE
jgi:PilZ domain-containing protein